MVGKEPSVNFFGTTFGMLLAMYSWNRLLKDASMMGSFLMIAGPLYLAKRIAEGPLNQIFFSGFYSSLVSHVLIHIIAVIFMVLFFRFFCLSEEDSRGGRISIDGKELP